MPMEQFRLYRSLLLLIGVVLLFPRTTAALETPDRLRLEIEQIEPVEEDPSAWVSIKTFLRRIPKFLQLRAGILPLPAPGTKFQVVAVAYSPTVDQNDISPCITATGARVAPDVVATNFLPFDTRLRIDGREYVVRDRMNAKYNGQYIIDIWHPTRREALAFGRQELVIEILGSPEAIARQQRRSVASVPSSPSPEPGASPEAPVEQTSPGFFTAISDILQRFIGARSVLPDVDCLKTPSP